MGTQPSQAIGVFDSGLGGLTIVKAIQRLLPNESVTYFGDTAHLPYGDKSPELIRVYCRNITRHLVGQGVKAIVIACNTASAVALDVVQEEAGEIPVLDVISPAVRTALQHSPWRSIGVIGTKTTIGSGVYGRRIREQVMNAKVVEKATPLLVPLIEEGWADKNVSREVIEAYLSDTGFRDIDTLILGCTHYPLIKREVSECLQKNFGREINIVDSSVAVTDNLRECLGDANLLADQGHEAHYKFCVSDLTPNFQAAARIFLRREVQLERVELDASK